MMVSKKISIDEIFTEDGGVLLTQADELSPEELSEIYDPDVEAK